MQSSPPQNTLHTSQKGNIRCVIFDLDGTLVDSESLCNQGYLDLIPELDVSLKQMTERYRGQKLGFILSDIEHRIGRKLPTDFEKNYRARVYELFDTDLRTVHGVKKMLESIHSPVCVASNGPLAKIKKALSITSLSHFFGDHVFSAYEINSWKPNPDLFLYAAKSMGYPPESCVVIEDTLLGIQAAHSAGIQSLLYSPDDPHITIPYSNSIAFSTMSELPDLIENGRR